MRKRISRLVKAELADLPPADGGAATEYAHGCAATVQAWCAEVDLDHVAPRRGEVVRWATGKGVASKETMRLAACHRFSRENLTDDEADYAGV